MMRSFSIVSVFAVLILCGQVSIPRTANAGCCFLPSCSGLCTKCSGSCPYCCGYRSPATFEASLISGNAMWDKVVIEDPLPPMVGSLDIEEHLAKITRGGECARRNFTLRMIGIPEQSVLANSAHFTEIAERALAFNIEPQIKE